jgi:uncharacterized protein (DUF433 family)
MSVQTQPTLTPTEAAVVASVTVRDVNRVIDERILPDELYAIAKDRTRLLFVNSCVLISFYFKTANQLTAEERIKTIADASTRLPSSLIREGSRRSASRSKWVVTEDFLTIDLAPFVKSVQEQFSRLQQARALVVEDPEILGGTPVVRNTRIPVYDVAASAAAGISTDRLLFAYPGLTARDVELAALYAEANPQRGRPRRVPSPSPRKVSLVASRRLPRRKRTA